MAQATKSPQLTVLEAQHRIFNKVCIGYRRSHQDPTFGIRAEDVRSELNLPEKVFAEALNAFVDANGQFIVESFESNGERYLRLGESAKYNCSD